MKTSMYRKLSFDELSIAKTPNKLNVVAFAYNFDNKSVVCAEIDVLNITLKVTEIPLHKLIFYPINTLLDKKRSRSTCPGKISKNLGQPGF